MANQGSISWPYRGHLNQTPYIDIRLYSLSNVIYPSFEDHPFPALIDTGFEGEVKIPNAVFNILKPEDVEIPQEIVYVANGTSVTVDVMYGYLSVPKISSEKYQIKMISFPNDATSDILIGSGFIKDFKILLDGPARRSILM